MPPLPTPWIALPDINRLAILLNAQIKLPIRKFILADIDIAPSPVEAKRQSFIVYQEKHWAGVDILTSPNSLPSVPEVFQVCCSPSQLKKLWGLHPFERYAWISVSGGNMSPAGSTDVSLPFMQGTPAHELNAGPLAEGRTYFLLSERYTTKPHARTS